MIIKVTYLSQQKNLIKPLTTIFRIIHKEK